MPTVSVTALGYVHHIYKFDVQDGHRVVPDSLTYRVISEEYIGDKFPPQRCSIVEVFLNEEDGGKSLVIQLRYLCQPANACPNFQLELSWQESPVIQQ